ncbi:MAG: glutamine synthetase [Actinomycetia bacterium]|nr:glutamine synthetase [Actinomycetes bacterium]MCP5031196.1 glutamine synthetase [Actinomycetes bacterium]
MERQQEYVLRAVEDRNVKLIRLWFTDVLGQLKSVAISPVELESAFAEGMHFDGSAIDGFSRVQESDVLAKPDPTTFELMPWADQGTTARMFCDIFDHGGTPFDGDPRQVLRRNLEQTHELGYSFFVAPEMEFFYFADGEPSHSPTLLDSGSYFDLTTSDVASDLRRETISVLETMGIPVEYSFHEDSPSQHEIDLRYTDAMSMADQVMTFRLVVRELALERGRFASFMPKPLEGLQGSGMHLHLSLFKDGENAFHDPEDPVSLSPIGRKFMAGLLVHAREITAITNQLVNSYKRLVVGFEAPVWVSWATNNRSALVRVPLTKPDKSSSTRIEYRSPDPACNPYLAFSVLLAAGMEGIKQDYDLPPETTENIFELDAEQMEAKGVEPLPQSLSEALSVMEGSSLVREALGEHIFEWFLRNKRDEWRDYKAHVSQWELERYLPSW